MSFDTFFFGEADAPLFGVHHPPRSDRDRGCGIVLVHSFGQEYIELHRALRQLATMLSDAGFSVLRFDLSSTGDSSGRCDAGHVDRWLADIDAAVAELRRREAVERLCCIGVRLGGALAARFAAGQGDVDALVLWDPVVDGGDYLKELGELHATMLQYAHVREDKSRAIPPGGELLGFPMSAETRQSIETIDLLGLEKRPAPKVLVVETNEKVPQRGLCERLQTLRSDVTLRRVPAPGLWEWLEDFGKVRVPQEMLQNVVAWLDEVDR
jgi:pimeloyl-ACP methyl ester carboxylesterase